MRATRKQSESGIYHVMSRGVGQQIIFESDADRRQYLDTLMALVERVGGSVLAWCLMDNHVHLLVALPFEVLSGVMRDLNSSYAQYFNLTHGRNGHLFQGRFKSEPVDTDGYLLTVLRYIHRNPVAAGMAKSCADYQWSSYGTYASGCAPRGAKFVTNMFDDLESLREFHETCEENAGCLEVSQPQRRLDDAAALRAAVEMFGDAGIANLKTLPRGERNDALARLKRRGLSVRQIQRLTGVSLGVISKA